MTNNRVKFSITLPAQRQHTQRIAEASTLQLLVELAQYAARWLAEVDSRDEALEVIEAAYRERTAALLAEHSDVLRMKSLLAAWSEALPDAETMQRQVQEVLGG